MTRQKFYDTALELNADIVAMSTLLTTSPALHGRHLKFIRDTGRIVATSSTSSAAAWRCGIRYQGWR